MNHGLKSASTFISEKVSNLEHAGSLNRTLGIFRFVHPLKMADPRHNRHTALSDKDSHKVRD